MEHLKERTIRGGFAKLCAQATNFVLRVGFIAVLARLLSPEDFGLVGMVNHSYRAHQRPQQRLAGLGLGATGRDQRAAA